MKQLLVGPSDPNFCCELDAKDSLVFPQNYAYYVLSKLFPLVFLFGGKLVKRNLLQLLNPFFILLLGILGNCRRFPIPAPRRPKPETELREFDDSTDYLRRIFLRESVANKSITKANALTDDGAKIILSPIAETIGLSSILKSIHQTGAKAHSNSTLAPRPPSATELMTKTLANATLDDAGTNIGLANGTPSTGDVVAEDILAVDWGSEIGLGWGTGTERGMGLRR